MAITIGVPVGSSNIFTIASDGSDRMQLTDGVAFSHSATWSPGGGRLVYFADADIYIMNGDGTKRTYITRSPEVLGCYTCTADWGS